MKYSLDLDVLVRAVPGEADHLACELDNANRLAHLEHEDLALLRHRAGLQHEAHGLGDRHEVARHLGVGHGDRTAFDDLAEEGRDDAAATAQHVAESHGRERQRVLFADRQHGELRGALARAHDATGVGRFVGGDVDEGATVIGRYLREGPGAEQVGLHGFGRVRLEDRDVLVGRGVKDHVGLVAVEDLAQASLVPDVGEDRLRLVEARHSFEEQAVVAVEQQEARRAVARHLAGDLAADRAAGSGDENVRAFEVVGDVTGIDRSVLAAEEVGEVEIAQAVHQRRAVHVGGAREDLHLRVGLERACLDRAQALT